MATIAVRYCTRSGHSRQIAEAIGARLGVPALDVSEGLKEPVDQLFLCSGLYAGMIDKRLKAFLLTEAKKAKEVVNVSSSASGRSTRGGVAKLAGEGGFTLSPRDFCCKGAFHFIMKGHPDQDDLKAAADFAAQAAGKE